MAIVKIENILEPSQKVPSGENVLVRGILVPSVFSIDYQLDLLLGP